MIVAAINQPVARFDVAAVSIDEGGGAEEIGIVVVVSVRSDDAGIVDIVERGKQRDVEICKAERLPSSLQGNVTAPPRIASFAQMPFCRNSGKRPTVKGRSKLASCPENPE